MEFFKKLIVIVFIGFVLIACGNPIVQTEVTITYTPLLPSTPSKTPFPTLPRQPTFTVGPTKTPTLTPTLNPTQNTWISTYSANLATQKIAIQQAKEIRETKIAQFPIVCDNQAYGRLSPNGEWLATSCSYKTDQTLIVQNKEGTKWVMEFDDFLHPRYSNSGMPGSIQVLFWSPDSEYLYFTNSLGWSGGGNFCFPGFGTNGLFRLDLDSGIWFTLIPPPVYFPGDEIKFSPNGRRYAVDINGITINDLNTGDAIQINVEGVIEFVWSPDGKNLAYSIASCNEEGFVTSSSLYIWDSVTNESKLIITTDRILLNPLSWNENSPLKIEGEEYILEDKKTIFTLYEYDINQDELVFIGPTSLLP